MASSIPSFLRTKLVDYPSQHAGDTDAYPTGQAWRKGSAFVSRKLKTDIKEVNHSGIT